MNIRSFIKSWLKEEDAIAAIEASLIFPVLLTLMLGVFDLGNGILANQKAIRASQVVADLITRDAMVDDAMIDDAIDAATMALDPFPIGTFGVDILSVSFDDDGDVTEEFRTTENMSPVPDAMERVGALSDGNSGLVMVAVVYNYEPIFGNFVIGTIEMQEIAFSRGRNSGVVCKDTCSN